MSRIVSRMHFYVSLICLQVIRMTSMQEMCDASIRTKLDQEHQNRSCSFWNITKNEIYIFGSHFARWRPKASYLKHVTKQETFGSSIRTKLAQDHQNRSSSFWDIRKKQNLYIWQKFCKMAAKRTIFETCDQTFFTLLHVGNLDQKSNRGYIKVHTEHGPAPRLLLSVVITEIKMVVMRLYFDY